GTNFPRYSLCGLCEEACPPTAIQLTPDVELGGFKRQDLEYEKEDLLISGAGKDTDSIFYHKTGVAVAGKNRGEASNGAKPSDVKSLLA
ncbi:NADH-quinone oxidoreductase subunit I, partial [Morganella morganii]|nr:NADH-quinone oxidoreductase subunit I [Morganella morganii]